MALEQADKEWIQQTLGTVVGSDAMARRVAEIVGEIQKTAPKPLTKEEITALVTEAVKGQAPKPDDDKDGKDKPATLTAEQVAEQVKSAVDAALKAQGEAATQTRDEAAKRKAETIAWLKGKGLDKKVVGSSLEGRFDHCADDAARQAVLEAINADAKALGHAGLVASESKPANPFAPQGDDKPRSALENIKAGLHEILPRDRDGGKDG